MQRVLPPNATLVPKGAKKVFEGEIFNIYQWPETMYDGTVATFEMLKRSDTVKIIGIKGDKLVVTEENQPHGPLKISFPGGHVDDRDGSWEVAAQREMREETGLSFKNWRLIDVAQPVPKIEWFVGWFIAWDVVSDEDQTPDAGELIKVQIETFENTFNKIFSTENSETRFLPKSVIDCKSVEELLAVSEYKV